MFARLLKPLHAIIYLTGAFTAVHLLAQTPTSYSGQATPTAYYDTFSGNGYDCSGTIHVSGTSLDTLNNNYANGVLNSGVCLSRRNGAWIPYASPVNHSWVTAPGFPTALFTFQSNLDANGLITTYTSNGTFVEPNNPSQIIGLGNIEQSFSLVTGEYTQANTNRDIWPNYRNSCPAYLTYNERYNVTASFTLSVAATSCDSLQIVDPSRTLGNPLQFPLPPYVDPSTVQNAPAIHGVAADGASAIAIVFSSNSDAMTTFSLTASGASGNIGGLTAYDPAYLIDGPQTGSLTVQVSPVAPCPGGPCTFIALLWSPSKMPSISGQSFSAIPLTITATQGSNNGTSTVSLLPPPVVLVHGIWGSPGNWSDFMTWLGPNYPHNLIYLADYKQYHSLSFADPLVQGALTHKIQDALVDSANHGVVARKVDVVGHSMGGLVTRYLMENPSSSLPSSPIHKLITVATPHTGSALATALVANQSNLLNPITNPVTTAMCVLNGLTPCRLGALLNALQMPVGPGVESLESGLPNTIEPHSAIIGLAPPSSVTETLLDAVLINPFVPGQSVASILGSSSDTIVTTTSQGAGATDAVTVEGVVHACAFSILGFCALEPPLETEDLEIWQQVLNSLEGVTLTGTVPALKGSPRSTPKPQSNSTAPAPVFDLTGYKQVPISDVKILPASNTSLTLGSAATITTTSSSKTLSEVFVVQKVTDPADLGMLYSTQSPFSMSFTPARLSTISFIYFAVFTDNTYATTTLTYPVQASGAVSDVRIPNPPIASLSPAQTVVVDAVADYPNQPVDITTTGTYVSRSKTANVFKVGANGTLTTTNNGVDWLDVSYGGQSASTLISVGNCTYTLSPTNQIGNHSGSTVTIQISTQSGCGWTVASDSTWLVLTNVSGIGSGTIYATTAANTTGAVRSGYISVGTKSVAVTQATTSCSYSVTPTALNLPFTGGKGTLAVVTSCPIISFGNQTWADAVTLSSTSVEYVIDPNTTIQARIATLTVGTQQVSVTEGGMPDFSVTSSSNSLTMKQGQSASASITLTPINGYNSLIALSCSGLPAGASCSFTPSSVTPNGGVVSSQMTIQTTGPMAQSKPVHLFPNRGEPILLTTFVITFLGFRRRRASKSMVMLALILAAVSASLLGCASNATSTKTTTPTGTYSMTITATGASSTNVHSIPLTITVN